MRTWPAIDVTDRSGGPADTLASGLFQASLTDYQVAAIDERTPACWRVFFHTNAERDRAVAGLRATFLHLSLDPVDVPDEDWAARSQADLRSVRVGDVIVSPPWDVPDRDADAAAGSRPIVIVIVPSMGFGTGHHATTRLCLDALQAVEVRGRRVMDIGTGSGVLAIAASLLGGREVVGIDEDPDAIHAASENVALNPRASVTLIPADFRWVDLVPSNIVLANLTGGLLAAAAERLSELTAPGGRLILSGLLTQEERDVLDTYPIMSIERRTEEAGWVCVTLRRT
jgi:ribosomal protein L11 methyltransferase